MPPADRVAAIIRELREAGTPQRQEVAAWYFRSTLISLGVSAPAMHQIGKRVARELKSADPGDVIKLAQELVDSQTQEGRIVAYLLLNAHKPARQSLDRATVERLGTGNDNWGTVDAFATLVSGVAWREGRLSDATIRKWARSKDLWWRRTALVSTVALNCRSKGGTGDPRRTLPICEMLAADREPMVAKALSWALRELIVWDRGAVERFLQEHDGELASLVKREVRNKLESGLKNPKR